MKNETFLRERAPAIFATAPAAHTSADYKFQSTLEIIDAFEAQGWNVVDARQVKARKRSGDHAKHMVSLTHDSMVAQAREIGSVIPRINLINSHDWSSRFELILGLFRLVCGNGMQVAAGTFGAISIRHDAPLADTVGRLTAEFGSMGNRVIETAEAWDRIYLSDSAQREFATYARNIRFGAESTVDPMSLLTMRREADAGDTLWRVFNRIQENSTKGGLRFAGMRRRSREIKNISKDVEVNRALWAQAEALALA